MPLLRKQPFLKHKPPANLHPDEEVFYCKITNEIFRDYEVFFERIILCNSLVWSCSITGRSGLTYQEATECEEKAKKHLATFQESLQKPLLFMASLTHRGRLADLNDDVFLFAKDRYFIGETVDVLIGGERKSSKVVKVVSPAESSSKSNGDVIVIDEDSESDGDDSKEPPAAESMMYIVHPSTGKNNRVMVKASQVSRKKGLYTRDKSKLFLKQNCEPVDGVWSVKESVKQKFCLFESRYEHFYGGPRPKFVASVIKKKYAGKSPGSSASTTPNTSAPPSFSSSTISNNSPDEVSGVSLAERAAQREQERLARIAEKLAKSQEVRHKMEEDKQRRKEERDKEREKKREEKRKEMEKLKEWSRPRDDLECDDLKPLPELRPVQTRLPTRLFGEALMVLEYINAFKNVFDFKQFFSKGFTWELLEAGLMEADPQGPLCDLLQMLLCALFNLQEEEAEEYQELEKEERDKPPAHPAGEEETLEEEEQVSNNELIRSATSAAQFSQLTFGMALRDTLLDQFTLTEVVRLHLMSSGARANNKNARFRYQQRGGYSSLDDPGLELRRQDPALLKRLATGNIFDLLPEDKLRLMSTLVQQVMTYAAVRDIIEESYDKLRVKKYDLKLLQWAELRRIKEDQMFSYRREVEEKTKEREYRLKDLARSEQLRQAREQGLEPPQLPPLEAPPLSRDQLREREQQEAAAEAAKRGDYQRRELDTLTSILNLQRCNALCALGRDRHYRRYWAFSTLPALLVEDHELFLGSGPQQPPSASAPSPSPVPPPAGQDELNTSSDKENDAQAPAVNGVHQPDSADIGQGATLQGRASDQDTDVKDASQALADKDAVIKDSSDQDRKDALIKEASDGLGQATATKAARDQDDKDVAMKATSDQDDKDIAMKASSEDDKEIVMKASSDTDTITKGKVEASVDSSAQRADCGGSSGVEPPSLNSSGNEALDKRQPAPLWFVVDSQTCLKQLIAALNARGFRESALSAVLQDFHSLLNSFIDACPQHTLCLPPQDPQQNARTSAPKVTEGSTQSDSASEAMELTLRDGLLDLEDRIHVGSLGCMKVEDRGIWRACLESGGYSPQTNEPPFARAQTPKKKSVGGSVHIAEEVVARDLAYALVQIARGVESRFLTHPLGDEDGRRKSSKEEGGDKRRVLYERWEESALGCTSLSQVFLHLAALDKSVKWDRSALLARCRICRRKSDPDKMLLCDKCDRGHHMYCLKPPMTRVPAGDWFCPNCRPKLPAPSPRKNRRRTFSEVEEEEEEEQLQLQDTIQEEASEEEGEEEAEEDEEEGGESLEEEEESEEEEEENEDVCTECRQDGKLILCDVCPRSYHMECARPPLKKVPKGKWMCQVCVGGNRAGKIQFKTSPGPKHRPPPAKKETPKSQTHTPASSGKGGKSGSRPGSRRETPRNSPTPTSTSASRTKKDSTPRAQAPKSKEGGARSKDKDKDWTPKEGSGRSKDKDWTPKEGSGRSKDKDWTPKSWDGPPAKLKRSASSVSRLSSDGGAEFEISARQYTSSKRGNSQVQQMKAVEELLQEVIKHQDAWPFLKPVDKKLVPDYYEVIAHPMDLSSIRNKVHAFQYSLPSQLLADLRLIFTNCSRYNARTTPEYRAGHSLDKFVQTRLRQLGLQDQDQDQPPAAKKQRR